jgi:DNA invertase Pin-like site-specific DNA recombinase
MAPLVPPVPAPALPRFVELVRVSSHGQAARDTPADQRAALERLRLSRPGRLVERIEQQVSGAADGVERPDLARLAELAAARAFDEVRVRHLDRLTRHDDPLERAAVLSMVRRAGAVIVDAGGSVLDPRTMGGELTWVVSTLASAEERRKILERTSAAKARLAAEGRLVHGRPPYGRTWDRAAGRWGLDEHQAAVYRRLFDLCLAGRSLRAIARALNAEGEPSPGGAAWDAAIVSRLLREPAAAGHYRTHGAAFEIPPVVDDATLAAAGERLRGNSRCSGPPAKHPALLRKLLMCGVCGAPLYVTKGAGAFYYYCSAGDPTCRVYHRVERVDAAVRAAVEAFLARPAALRAAAERDRPEDDAELAGRDAAAARRELEDLDHQEERVARLLRRELIAERTGERQLGEVRRLRAVAEGQLAAAEARARAAARRGEVAAALEARVAELRAGLGAATFEDWRELLEVLFPRTAATGVVVQPNGQLELRGAIPLDARGEAELAGVARAAADRTVVPLRLAASSRR